QFWQDAGARMGTFVHPQSGSAAQARHVILGPGFLIPKGAANPSLSWSLIKELVSESSMVRLAELTNRLPSLLAAFPAWERIYEEKMIGGRYVLMAVQNGRGMPYNDRWTDMNREIGLALNRIWSGEMPPRS